MILLECEQNSDRIRRFQENLIQMIRTKPQPKKIQQMSQLNTHHEKIIFETQILIITSLNKNASTDCEIETATCFYN